LEENVEDIYQARDPVVVWQPYLPFKPLSRLALLFKVDILGIKRDLAENFTK
jgi:hypothetical protein